MNRGTLSGQPVDQLASAPLPRADFQAYEHDNLERPKRAGKLESIINHMGNFVDCIASRKLPISDVSSQHRSATTCHVGNIAMQLGRPLRWDAQQEQFLDDQEANRRLRREQRTGFEVV